MPLSRREEVCRKSSASDSGTTSPSVATSPAVSRLPSDAPSIHASMGRFILASPYSEDGHLLDLHTLDKENQLMARSLVYLDNVRPDYATAPYTQAFNWGVVMAELKHFAREYNYQWRETHFYVVVFRSQIPTTTVRSELGALDEAAHKEAVHSGGLLKYWFGVPDDDGRNLATCVWRSQEDAIKGGTGPEHRKAAVATRKLYTHWKIDRFRIIVRDSIRTWEIVDWDDGSAPVPAR